MQHLKILKVPHKLTELLAINYFIFESACINSKSLSLFT